MDQVKFMEDCFKKYEYFVPIDNEKMINEGRSNTESSYVNTDLVDTEALESLSQNQFLQFHLETL